MKKTVNIILMIFIAATMLCSCSEKSEMPETPMKITGLVFKERVKNRYAEQFIIDRYEDGYSVIHTMDGESFLIVPEGRLTPENCSLTVINRPLENVYLAATSAMGLFCEIDSADVIKYTGTKAEDWYIDQAKKAMENGTMLYAGKYREPDYELLFSGQCSLSIQSTMINHTPEVKDKLSELGIPVFVDHSSYESHPLGRSEWIKVYGEMCGKSDLANELFEKQAKQLEAIENTSTGKSAVFFYISASGQAVTRKSGDYVTKMIELAGGENVFSDLGDSENASSSVTLEMEEFYTAAKNADYIIYNSAINGEVETIEELIEKNSLLADFKAVQNGNVWCTKENLFQETMKLGTVISDFNLIFTGKSKENPPEFLFRLEDSK